MTLRRFTEKELLTGLDANAAHADELADLLPQEFPPMERLRGSVKRYDRPTDPVWEEYVNSDDRDQTKNDRE